MNGDRAVSAAAVSAAGLPTVRRPSSTPNGIVATPASSEGARTSSSAWPICVVNQESTKDRGGVSSALLCTTETTSDRPCSLTTQKLDSSSPNRGWPATTRRTAARPTVSAGTISHAPTPSGTLATGRWPRVRPAARPGAACVWAVRTARKLAQGRP